MRRFAWLLAAGAAAVLLAGCAGYTLGPTNGAPAGAQSVQIEPFVNKTLEPRLNDYVMGSLRQRLQRDGTYRVDTHGEGDIILSGEITGYRRAQLTVQPTDVITALDYEITVTAQVRARERYTGKVLFDKLVTGRTSLRIGPDQASAERQVIPLVADDLAKKAARLLVDGTW
jgi:hypothetical protein